MKKLLAFILLSVFLYTQVGYFIAFKIRQYEVRREIKTTIKNSVPQQELTVIRIDNGKENELDWVKENKEFRYKGNLYDVVRKEITEGAIVYHCINDVQEQQLFTELDEHVRRHMSDQPVNGKSDVKADVKDYFIEEIIIPSVPSALQFIEYPVNQEAAPGRFIAPSSPPPEQA